MAAGPGSSLGGGDPRPFGAALAADLLLRPRVPMWGPVD